MSPDVFNGAELRCAEITRGVEKRKARLLILGLDHLKGVQGLGIRYGNTVPSTHCQRAARHHRSHCGTRSHVTVSPRYSRARRSSALFFKLFW